jgi:PAS domain S-box-containing protein
MRRLRARLGTFPLRYHLIALVLIALVPILIFAGTVVRGLGREQRASAERGLQTTVRALAIAVEREIGASVRALEVLATSTALDRGDLRTFHELARRAAQEEEVWDHVALTDAGGQVLVNSLRPFGAGLPSIADRDYFHELIRSGGPVVSDLITGRVTARPTVTVAVPVRRDGALRYVLFAAISPESLGRILAAQRIPADWIAGIADSHQVFIARNRDPEGFVGREMIAPMKQAVRGAAAGTGRYPVFDSPEVYAAWERTTLPGWTVTLGAPASAVDVPLRRSMWRLALGGFLAILAGGALAIALGWMISRSMGRLASAAAALGQGATPPYLPSLIKEAHAVGQEIENAGRMIKERTVELHKSQANLKHLVNSSLIGILVGEGDLITDANDAFLKMVGYSHEDLRNGTLRGSSLTPPEYGAADAAATTMARQTGDCPPYEKEYVRKDGTRVPVVVGSVFLDGARRQWVSFALDLTERNRLEAEQTLRISAQTANQAKDNFLAILSHELRTPLSTVLNSVHVLRRGQLGEAQVAEILDRIDRSTRLQAKLIDDLLDASRILAGKLQVDKNVVHLVPIVTAAAAALAAEARGKGVELRTVLDGPPGSVLGDPERLQQIALNLIANAIKFTPPGGHVQVSLGSRAARIVLTVRDTGRGIEPELIPHIFDRFWQGAAGRRQGGLGLGLTIVRHLVEAHDGTVRVESAGVGRGAVFTVELPMAAHECTAAGAVAQSDRTQKP